ncbi:hypothetical protein RP29_15450, partial [Acidovorax temperans]
MGVGISHGLRSLGADARDTEEGPPRTEGVVPQGGRREATQGGQMTFASFLSFSTRAATSATLM